MKNLCLALAGILALAACEPEKGAGFTGIGQPTQSVIDAYALDFSGLRVAR